MRYVLTLSLSALLALGVLGCERDRSAEDVGADVGESLERGAQETGEAIDRTMEGLREGAEETGEAAERAGERATPPPERPMTEPAEPMGQ